ncbi:hypothetical protein HK102_008952 [Quaeritorhiza haematococci]|nr:hypothetical protein HK102_008952 [Quaeritorhiza haematococci]
MKTLLTASALLATLSAIQFQSTVALPYTDSPSSSSPSSPASVYSSYDAGKPDAGKPRPPSPPPQGPPAGPPAPGATSSFRAAPRQRPSKHRPGTHLGQPTSNPFLPTPLQVTDDGNPQPQQVPLSASSPQSLQPQQQFPVDPSQSQLPQSQPGFQTSPYQAPGSDYNQGQQSYTYQTQQQSWYDQGQQQLEPPYGNVPSQNQTQEPQKSPLHLQPPPFQTSAPSSQQNSPTKVDPLADPFPTATSGTYGMDSFYGSSSSSNTATTSTSAAVPAPPTGNWNSYTNTSAVTTSAGSVAYDGFNGGEYGNGDGSGAATTNAPDAGGLVGDKDGSGATTTAAVPTGDTSIGVSVQMNGYSPFYVYGNNQQDSSSQEQQGFNYQGTAAETQQQQGGYGNWYPEAPNNQQGDVNQQTEQDAEGGAGATEAQTSYDGWYGQMNQQGDASQQQEQQQIVDAEGGAPAGETQQASYAPWYAQMHQQGAANEQQEQIVDAEGGAPADEIQQASYGGWHGQMNQQTDANPQQEQIVDAEGGAPAMETQQAGYGGWHGQMSQQGGATEQQELSIDAEGGVPMGETQQASYAPWYPQMNQQGEATQPQDQGVDPEGGAPADETQQASHGAWYPQGGANEQQELSINAEGGVPADETQQASYGGWHAEMNQQQEPVVDAEGGVPVHETQQASYGGWHAEINQQGGANEQQELNIDAEGGAPAEETRQAGYGGWHAEINQQGYVNEEQQQLDAEGGAVADEIQPTSYDGWHSQMGQQGDANQQHEQELNVDAEGGAPADETQQTSYDGWYGHVNQQGDATQQQELDAEGGIGVEDAGATGYDMGVVELEGFGYGDGQQQAVSTDATADESDYQLYYPRHHPFHGNNYSSASSITSIEDPISLPNSAYYPYPPAPGTPAPKYVTLGNEGVNKAEVSERLEVAAILAGGVTNTKVRQGPEPGDDIDGTIVASSGIESGRGKYNVTSAPNRLSVQFEWIIPKFLINTGLLTAIEEDRAGTEGTGYEQEPRIKAGNKHCESKLVSIPFGPEDWRWQAVVYPHGAGFAKGTHMSGFLRPLKNARETASGESWRRPTKAFSFTMRRVFPDVVEGEEDQKKQEGQDVDEEAEGLKGATVGQWDELATAQIGQDPNDPFEGFHAKRTGWGFPDLLHQSFLFKPPGAHIDDVENVDMRLERIRTLRNDWTMVIEIKIEWDVQMGVASCSLPPWGVYIPIPLSKNDDNADNANASNGAIMPYVNVASEIFGPRECGWQMVMYSQDPQPSDKPSESSEAEKPPGRRLAAQIVPILSGFEHMLGELWTRSFASLTVSLFKGSVEDVKIWEDPSQPQPPGQPPYYYGTIEKKKREKIVSKNMSGGATLNWSKPRAGFESLIDMDDLVKLLDVVTMGVGGDAAGASGCGYGLVFVEVEVEWDPKVDALGCLNTADASNIITSINANAAEVNTDGAMLAALTVPTHPLVAPLVNRLSTTNQSLMTLTTSHNNLQNEYNTQELELRRLKAELDVSNARRSELEVRYADSAREVMRLQGEVSRMVGVESVVEKMRAELVESRERYVGAVKECGVLRSRLAGLKKGLVGILEGMEAVTGPASATAGTPSSMSPSSPAKMMGADHPTGSLSVISDLRLQNEELRMQLEVALAEKGILEAKMRGDPELDPELTGEMDDDYFDEEDFGDDELLDGEGESDGLAYTTDEDGETDGGAVSDAEGGAARSATSTTGAAADGYLAPISVEGIGSVASESGSEKRGRGRGSPIKKSRKARALQARRQRQRLMKEQQRQLESVLTNVRQELESARVALSDAMVKIPSVLSASTARRGSSGLVGSSATGGVGAGASPSSVSTSPHKSGPMVNTETERAAISADLAMAQAELEVARAALVEVASKTPREVLKRALSTTFHNASSTSAQSTDLNNPAQLTSTQQPLDAEFKVLKSELNVVRAQLAAARLRLEDEEAARRALEVELVALGRRYSDYGLSSMPGLEAIMGPAAAAAAAPGTYYEYDSTAQQSVSGTQMEISVYTSSTQQRDAASAYDSKKTVKEAAVANASDEKVTALQAELAAVRAELETTKMKMNVVREVLVEDMPVSSSSVRSSSLPPRTGTPPLPPSSAAAAASRKASMTPSVESRRNSATSATGLTAVVAAAGHETTMGRPPLPSAAVAGPSTLVLSSTTTSTATTPAALGTVYGAMNGITYGHVSAPGAPADKMFGLGGIEYAEPWTPVEEEPFGWDDVFGKKSGKGKSLSKKDMQYLMQALKNRSSTRSIFRRILGLIGTFVVLFLLAASTLHATCTMPQRDLAKLIQSEEAALIVHTSVCEPLQVAERIDQARDVWMQWIQWSVPKALHGGRWVMETGWPQVRRNGKMVVKNLKGLVRRVSMFDVNNNKPVEVRETEPTISSGEYSVSSSSSAVNAATYVPPPYQPVSVPQRPAPPPIYSYVKEDTTSSVVAQPTAVPEQDADTDGSTGSVRGRERMRRPWDRQQPAVASSVVQEEPAVSSVETIPSPQTIVEVVPQTPVVSVQAQETESVQPIVAAVPTTTVLEEQQPEAKPTVEPVVKVEDVIVESEIPTPTPTVVDTPAVTESVVEQPTPESFSTQVVDDVPAMTESTPAPTLEPVKDEPVTVVDQMEVFEETVVSNLAERDVVVQEPKEEDVPITAVVETPTTETVAPPVETEVKMEPTTVSAAPEQKTPDVVYEAKQQRTPQPPAITITNTGAEKADAVLKEAAYPSSQQQKAPQTPAPVGSGGSLWMELEPATEAPPAPKSSVDHDYTAVLEDEGPADAAGKILASRTKGWKNSTWFDAATAASIVVPSGADQVTTTAAAPSSAAVTPTASVQQQPQVENGGNAAGASSADVKPTTTTSVTAAIPPPTMVPTTTNTESEPPVGEPVLTAAFEMSDEEPQVVVTDSLEVTSVPAPSESVRVEVEESEEDDESAGDDEEETYPEADIRVVEVTSFVYTSATPAVEEPTSTTVIVSPVETMDVPPPSSQEHHQQAESVEMGVEGEGVVDESTANVDSVEADDRILESHIHDEL